MLCIVFAKKTFTRNLTSRWILKQLCFGKAKQSALIYSYSCEELLNPLVRGGYKSSVETTVKYKWNTGLHWEGFTLLTKENCTFYKNDLRCKQCVPTEKAKRYSVGKTFRIYFIHTKPFIICKNSLFYLMASFQ